MRRFNTQKQTRKPVNDFAVRRKVLLAFMLGGMALLVGRAFDLQVLNKQFLKQQGDMRHVSEVAVSAYRGMILDRNDEPLAISSPVESAWVNPMELAEVAPSDIKQVEQLLGLSEGKIAKLIIPGSKRQFVYVKRRINPDLAERVKKLSIKGVYFDREF